MLNQTSPKVFISYSWDSTEHKNRVLALSNQLRDWGIDCNIDRYEFSPPEDWPRWMAKQIREADFVLVVCTATYKRRFDGQEETGKGHGIRWERHLTYQDLYNAGTLNTKFIPILDDNHSGLLRGGSWHSYPAYCRSASRVRYAPDYVNYLVGFRVVCVGAAART